MLHSLIQRKAEDFARGRFASGEFALDFSGDQKLEDSPLARVNNPKLVAALSQIENNLSSYLKPEDDARWRGVTATLRDPRGDAHVLWRLARRVNFEEVSYTLNLHYASGQLNPKLEVDSIENEKFMPRIVTADQCTPHRHPFGDMAVRIYEGEYYMGVGAAQQHYSQFDWGLVAQGNRYFMDASLQHGILPISGHVISAMVHEKVPRANIPRNEFSGVGEMPAAEKASLLQLFRQKLSLDLSQVSMPALYNV
jgi:hypothetical protein